MNITEELRKWAHNSASATTVDEAILIDIADHIDAEHEKALAEQYASLTYDMKPMTDENMAKDGWVRLPVDADGVLINVGDETWPINLGPSWHSPVDFMTLTEDGWRVGGGKPSELRHWKAPTIEDTLQELREKAVGHDIAHTTAVRNTITEYAERIKEMTRDA